MSRRRAGPSPTGNANPRAEVQAVRTLSIDGEPWFVLADLARVLGIRQVSRLASRLDDALRLTHPIVDSLGRTQQATIVSEAGMYEVVIRSDKAEAVAFRRWIASERDARPSGVKSAV